MLFELFTQTGTMDDKSVKPDVDSVDICVLKSYFTYLFGNKVNQKDTYSIYVLL